MNPTNARTSVTTTEALSKQEASNLEFNTSAGSSQARADEGKAFQNLRAAAALKGIALIATTDDRERPMYVASRWALCKSFDSLDAVGVWLEFVTGRKA